MEQKKQLPHVILIPVGYRLDKINPKDVIANRKELRSRKLLSDFFIVTLL
jgi:hypothetical protein